MDIEEAKKLINCTDEDLWFTFVNVVRGYSFEGLCKWEVFENRKSNRERLLQTVLGKDPFIRRYKNVNYNYFYRERTLACI